jgi:hypothetical protein
MAPCVAELAMTARLQIPNRRRLTKIVRCRVSVMGTRPDCRGLSLNGRHWSGIGRADPPSPQVEVVLTKLGVNLDRSSTMSNVAGVSRLPR